MQIMSKLGILVLLPQSPIWQQKGGETVGRHIGRVPSVGGSRCRRKRHLQVEGSLSLYKILVTVWSPNIVFYLQTTPNIFPPFRQKRRTEESPLCGVCSFLLPPGPAGALPGDQDAVVLDAGDGLVLLLADPALDPLLQQVESAFAVVEREVVHRG